MTKTLALSNGVEMPVLGLGVYQIPDGVEARRAVMTAFELGYRLIDTAALYGNEASVGLAVKDSGLSRNDIFVTTKLHPLRVVGIERAFYSSLKRLGLDHVDLFLIHWPFLRTGKIWEALQRVLARGDVRSIGVSNFRIRDIESLSGMMPTVNQVEFHPFLYRKSLLEYAKSKGIALEAHSPLMHGKRLNDPRIQAIAERCGKSVPQILIRWSLQHGLVVIPKAVKRDQMKANIDVFDFSIGEAEMLALDALNDNYHVAGLSRIVGDPA